jgi:putative intracellular protease/amidase
MDTPRIGFVVFDGFQPLDLVGPHEVFGHAGYRSWIVASRAGLVRSRSGLPVHAEHGVADADPADVDTLVVVGGEGVDDARRDPALVGWIAAVGATARRVWPARSTAAVASVTR